MTSAEFTTARQTAFTETVANISGVTTSDVTITGYSDTTVRGSGGALVQFTVATTVTAASSLASTLQTSASSGTLSTQLEATGFPPTTATATATVATLTAPSTFDNEQVLSSAPPLILRWTLTSSGLLWTQVQAQSSGWVGLARSSSGAMLGSEGEVASTEADGSEGEVASMSLGVRRYKLIAKNGADPSASVEHVPTSFGDASVVAGNGLVVMTYGYRHANPSADTTYIWAVGSSTSLSYHGSNRGAATVNLTAGAVQVEIVAAGTISAFDGLSFASTIATALSLPSSSVRVLGVVAGSVRATTQIIGGNGVTAAAAVADLNAKVASSDASISSLGITSVVSLPAVTDSLTASPSPAPATPSSSHHTGPSGGLILLLCL
eukprot:CAMPEP_0117064600 /NCGR_PEP_ID=MMETSP0472-20121206/45129_1 /TAXON_ID=693140 ORGANISM="Tiarina fusus, Strain LIS" /NCGR_SAMPLE_ID=MMETSP0472 /ASSEMBLY_ACC=CAM_ASM_000603 /LENGTH=379 /DNA_ID=CAMNT_0004784829 /DNA_START=1 /DNA_END=1138 /DNA_ORIENTATION=+